jgi:pimeloyl-ACP methyl ester carboxylesterase
MSQKAPIVFVHGLWLHRTSWQAWETFFQERGHTTLAVSWPGDGATVDDTRNNPRALAGVGVHEIAAHVAAQVHGFAKNEAVLVGHSLGGLIVQRLLAEGRGAAAIAIDPAPIKGVWQVPLSVLKATLPAVGNPFNYRRAVALTPAQFRYAFASAVAEEEARELYDRWAIPAPCRPLFQAATATFNPRAATKVDVNAQRGPLLFIAGEQDHTVPASLVRSAQRRYEKSRAVTELKPFAGRGHSLTIDSGWRDVADTALLWLRDKGLA